jgi:CRP-like cAMP-binding protein
LAKVFTLCSVADHFQLQPGEILYKKGDNGEAFYMVYSGVMEVLSERAPASQLYKGDAFGQEGLQNSKHTTVRTSTLKAITHTHLLQISKNDYITSLLIYQKSKIRRLISWLRTTCKIFQNWSLPRLYKLAAVMSVQEHKKDDVILSQGQPQAGCVYICRQGLLLLQKEELRYASERFPQDSYQWRETQTAHVQIVPVAFIEAGSIFGEEALMVPPKLSSQFTVVVHSKTVELLVIPAKALNLFDKLTIESVNDVVRQREDAHQVQLVRSRCKDLKKKCRVAQGPKSTNRKHVLQHKKECKRVASTSSLPVVKTHRQKQKKSSALQFEYNEKGTGDGFTKKLKIPSSQQILLKRHVTSTDAKGKLLSWSEHVSCSQSM